MANVPTRLYNEVMMLDSFTCVYCGVQDPDLAVDHVIARSVGGSDLIQNLVACCRICNSRKGDRALYEVSMFPMYGRYEYVRERIVATVEAPTDLVALRAMLRQMQRDGYDRPAIAEALYARVAERGDPMEAIKAAELFMQGRSPSEIVTLLCGIRSNQGGRYQRALEEVLELIRDGMASRRAPSQPTETPVED